MTPARAGWAAFAVGAGLLAAALAMVSRETLQLEAAERNTREQSLLEAGLRQVIWRIDTAMAGVLAVEAGRSPDLYRSSAFVSDPATPDLPPFALLH